MKKQPKAFPSSDATINHEEGMNLRDYFAARAMQAYMHDLEVAWDSYGLTCAARDAYKLADAMMIARRERDA